MKINVLGTCYFVLLDAILGTQQVHNTRETQVLMTVSNFFFFSRNHFLESGFTFQWEGFIFKWEATHGGHQLWLGVLQNPGSVHQWGMDNEVCKLFVLTNRTITWRYQQFLKKNKMKVLSNESNVIKYYFKYIYSNSNT